MGNPTQDILDALTAVKDYNKEQITYNDSTADAFTLYATRERLDFEIEGVEVLATESVVAWVVLASDITAGTSGDLPEFGDLITDADGKVYEVLGGNAGFPPYSQLTPFGDVLRIHTAERSEVPSIVGPSRVALFNGVDNYLQDASGDVSKYYPTSQYSPALVTYSVAFKSNVDPSTRTEDMFLVSLWGSAAEDRVFSLSVRDQDSKVAITVRLSTGASYSLAWPDVIELDKWYRAAAFVNRTTNQIGISVNGGAFITASAVTASFVNPGFVIGRYIANADYSFSGEMSGVGAWSKQLTQAEALELANLDGSGAAQPVVYSDLEKMDQDITTGLIEWLNLDEGDSVFAESVDGGTLTNVNSVTTTPYP